MYIEDGAIIQEKEKKKRKFRTKCLSRYYVQNAVPLHPSSSVETKKKYIERCVSLLQDASYTRKEKSVGGRGKGGKKSKEI